MEDPSLTSRAATITTLLPGADAERVEALVTEKIEEELKDIEEIKEITSSSRSGVSVIGIELNDSVDETVAATVWARIRNKASDSRRLLPSTASPPNFERLDIKAYALIVGLRWANDTPPSFAVMRRLLKQLKEEMDTIPGTEKSAIYGDPKEEVLVTIRPDAVSSLNLTPAAVSEQIRASDTKISAGLMRNPQEEILLEVSGEFDTLTRIAKTPIQFGEDGSFVALSDIATIEKSTESPVSSMVLLKDQPSIVLAVLVNKENRLDVWSKSAHEVIDRFTNTLPPGIEIELVFEQSKFVDARMNSFLNNLLTGAFAIYIVVHLLMGWRSAVIISLSLPLGCLLVLGCMNALNIEIHQMSLTGLVLALGIMIDNAIVIVDEVHHKIEEGSSPYAASSASVKYLAVPLAASTFTTVITFAPIAFMPGPTGEFVGSIGSIAILGVVSTLIISLTIVAGIASLLLKPTRNRRNWFFNGISIPVVTKIYAWCIRTTLKAPAMCALALFLIHMAGYYLVTKLPEQFFPPADRNQFHVELELPSTASIDSTAQVATEIRAILLNNDKIANVAWFLGESAPPFYYNVIPDRKNSPRYGQAIIDCKDGVDVKTVIEETQETLNRSFPQATCLVRQLEQGPPFSAPIEVRVFGPDIQVLAQIGDDLRRMLSETSNIVHTRSELNEFTPKIVFDVDERQARIAGLTNTSIANVLNQSLDGTLGGSILETTEELPVRVRVSDDARSNLNKIASLDIVVDDRSTPVSLTANDYRGIPIDAISTLQLKSEIAGIGHLNGRRMNEIQAFTSAGSLPAVVQANFVEKLEKNNFQLPEGYSLQFSGAEAERDSAVTNLLANTSILVACMVVVLVLSLGSFRYAALISIIGIMASGIAISCLWVCGYTWGFMAILGVVGMKGIAINDSIVILSALKCLPADQRRDLDAITNVVVSNTRHVLATTFTTVIGFIPLIMMGGDFWPPVAVSISGGVLAATALAIVFVPCAFLLITKHPKTIEGKTNADK